MLAAWSGWGAVPEVFEETRTTPRWAGRAREQLRDLAGPAGYAAARRTTVNAHYTDPAYAQVIWDAVTGLGFAGGRVLEPGCGAGAFIGTAPPDLQVSMVGVELDPVSAAVAAARFPQATIRAESFADTDLPQDSFDAAIGNVPFADVVAHDPVHNRGRHVLHNHVILKALALTRPGGLVAVLTSRFTLDATDPRARREMAAVADLVGAVRLPTGAHRRLAGTEAVTDLMLLRRREPERPPANQDWVDTVRLGVPGAEPRRGVPVNRYLADRPHLVLGRMQVGTGMHGSQTLQVHSDALGAVPDQLREAVTGISRLARDRGRRFVPAPLPALAPPPAASMTPTPMSPDGHISRSQDGFVVGVGGRAEPLQVPASQHRELAALLGLCDRARRVLDLESGSGVDGPDLETARSRLAAAYRDYGTRHGPINRFTTRMTGRRTDDGTPRTARVAPPVMRIFRTDPGAPLVFALEHFDAATQTATGADILSRRVIVPREPIEMVQTAAEAVAVCLDRLGRLDLDVLAGLLGGTTEQARDACRTLVYDDPQTGRLLPATQYLSGDVRGRLEAAEAAAGTDAAYAENVAALRQVIPADLGMEDIQARLGAAWIDPATHRQFLADLLGTDQVQVESPGGGSGRSGARPGPLPRPPSGAPCGCRHRRSSRPPWSSARSRSTTSSATVTGRPAGS